MKLHKIFDLGDLMVFITLLVVAVISVYLCLQLEQYREQISLLLLGFLGTVVCFLGMTFESPRFQVERSTRYLFMIGQYACAFAMVWLVPFAFLSILTVIWSAALPHFFSLRKSLLVSSAGVFIWFWAFNQRWQEDVWIYGILFWSFHLFAVFAYFQFIREKSSREALQMQHSQMQATQHLMTELSKQTERTRIARDIHDLLGHHLTALTINLQVAEHLTEGEAHDKVSQCHLLAKQLLQDVRSAVGALRDYQNVDLLSSLETMVRQIESLKIDLRIDYPERLHKLPIERFSVAEAVLRTIQEAMTNTLRHSGAKSMQIQITTEAGVEVRIKDDGKVAAHWQEGNGLTGMRERIQAVGGKMDVSTCGRSLQIEVSVPLEASV